jgi:hypothetical protein
MINFIKFFKHTSPQGFFYIIEKMPNKLDKLAFFLSEEVDCFGSCRLMRLINALEEDEDSTCGNMIDIEKRGDFLYLGYVHNNPEYPYERLKISKKELFKLMIKWEKLMKEKPEEINLIQENDQYELIEGNVFYKKIFRKKVK